MRKRHSPSHFKHDAVTPILWGWNDKAKRYVDRATGRFLATNALEKLQRRNIGLIEADLQVVGNLLLDNKISLQTFQEAFAQTLKQLHLQQMVLARGGTQATTANDYLTVARTLKGEYEYLRGFAEDINRGYSIGKNGQQIPLTVGRFRQRIRLYAKNGRLSYETGRQSNAMSQGQTYSWRILGDAEHCASCLQYAAMGIQPNGVLPLPTLACECRANCLCRIEFASSLQEAIARSGLSAAA